MSTKYGSPDRRLLDDDVALTDHAIERFRQRTPHECDVDPRTAWRFGEWVKHPQVAQGDGHDEPPERVRVYCHADDEGSHAWGVAFLVGDSDTAHIDGMAPQIVLTINHLQGFDHGPTRAYLHSHGPHGVDVNE